MQFLETSFLTEHIAEIQSVDPTHPNEEACCHEHVEVDGEGR